MLPPLVLATLLSAPAEAAQCERPTTAVDVEVEVAEARKAYENRDAIALAAAVVDGRTALECIVEPVPEALSDAFHLTVGLWVAVEQGEPAAVPYLVAGGVDAQRGGLDFALTEPERSLVERLHPQITTWTAAPGPPVAPPLIGSIALDGSQDARRFPTSEPFLMQQVTGSSVAATHYVDPHGGAPAYVRRRPVLVGGATTFATIAAGFLGGALVNDRAFHSSTELSEGEFDRFKGRNRVLMVGAGASGAIALGSLGALGLTYRR